MELANFCQSLAHELNQSHSRLMDGALVGKYSDVPLPLLGPVFDDEKDTNFNWPPTSTAASWLILNSVWQRLADRESEIHKSALNGGEASESRLEDFRREIRETERTIIRRLDSLRAA